MMDMETCLNAKKAVELGFADRLLYEEQVTNIEPVLFSRTAVMNSLLGKLPRKSQPISNLYQRLHNLKKGF